jgi:MoaA/NifB/PqqE/SkfB family radical SAM enzyme
MDYSYFYIELTSRCALECPRCPRTYEKGTYKLSEIDPTILRNLVCDFRQEIKTIEFGGNYGDPIYHSQFHEIIKTIKSINPKIKIIIHTNGSHRSVEWWEETTRYLDKKDVVLFSIDGLKETNSLYRVNSDWDSIEKAIDVCRDKVFLLWKFIPFSFNENDIQKIILFAKEKGFNAFTIALSSRFDGGWITDSKVEPLKPSDRYITKKEAREHLYITPKCQGGSFHYINASGIYFPCCWSTSDKSYQNLVNQYDLNDYSFSEVMESSALKKFFLSVSSTSTASSNCLKYCGNDNISNMSRSSDNRHYLEFSNDVAAIETELESFMAKLL